MRWVHNEEHSLVEDTKGAVIATVHFPVYGALLSASPRLLEALELARLHIADMQALAEMERKGDRVPMGSTPYVLEQIDLAILRAKGRAQGDEEPERGPDMGEEDTLKSIDLGDEDPEKGPDMGDEDPESDPLQGK